MPEEYRRWSPVGADATWKIMIQARDAYWIDSVLLALGYVLTDNGTDQEKALAKIRTMSGREIIDGLQAYRTNAYNSVKAGLAAKKEPEA